MLIWNENKNERVFLMNEIQRFSLNSPMQQKKKN